MKGFLNYIGSRRFAIYLLVATTAVILSSNLLPNLSIMDAPEIERLKNEKPLIYAMSASWNVRKVTSSPYFQVLPAFLFLSITLCTLKRLRAELKRMEKGDVFASPPPLKHGITARDSAQDKKAMLSLLKARGWKTAERNNIIHAKKGEKGIWGSFCFHAGMNMALTGVLVSALTAFEGMLVMTEGFPLSTPAEIRGADNRKVGGFPFEEMALESFTPLFSEGYPVEYIGTIVAVDQYGHGRRHVIKVNSPLKIWNFNFIFREASYAPRMILRDREGKTILDAVINLSISLPGMADYFDVPDEGLRIKVELFPDYYMEGGEHRNRGKEPKNPALFVEITRWDKSMGRGFLLKGARESFEGYSIEFAELRHWMKLVVSRDFGVPIIIAGFMFISIGLGVRYLLNDKNLWVIMKDEEKGAKWEIGGRAVYFPAMFDEEVVRLVEDIRQLVRGV